MRRVAAALVAVGVLIVPAAGLATHVRPKATPSLMVPFVPAYQACAASDRTHGPPLDSLSCSSPQQASDYLTVGSPDANGSAAQSIGSYRADVYPGVPGPPNDNNVAQYVSITDVRCKAVSAACPASGADYAGELEARLSIQTSDHITSGSSDPATGAFTLAYEVWCSTTSDPSIGSTCSRQIPYIDSIYGPIYDGRRSVWELGPVQLWDGGADGDGNTTTDNTLFAVQGLFVP